MIPSENNAISMCERLAAVENRMNTLEHTVSENACKSELLVQRVDNFASYSRVASGRPVPSAPPCPSIRVSPPAQRIPAAPNVSTMVTPSITPNDGPQSHNMHPSHGPKVMTVPVEYRVLTAIC